MLIFITYYLTFIIVFVTLPKLFCLFLLNILDYELQWLVDINIIIIQIVYLFFILYLFFTYTRN